MTDHTPCLWCQRPIATDADHDKYEGGEGTHLCWSEWGNDPTCEGEAGAENIVKGLRAEKATLTADLAQCRAENEALRSLLIGIREGADVYHEAEDETGRGWCSELSCYLRGNVGMCVLLTKDEFAQLHSLTSTTPPMKGLP